MTGDDEEISRKLFNFAAPMLPVITDQASHIDPNIVGGFLVVFRANGVVACMCGDSPPSVMISVLKQCIEELSGEEGQMLETAYADTKGKAN